MQGLWNNTKTLMLMAAMMAIVSVAMLMAALVVISKNMRVLMADRIEAWLHRVLRRSRCKWNSRAS